MGILVYFKYCGNDNKPRSFLVAFNDRSVFVYICGSSVFFNLLRKKIAKKKREFDVESSEIVRKRDYTQRVFYQNEFVKRARLTNIHRVMLRRVSESLFRNTCILSAQGNEACSYAVCNSIRNEHTLHHRRADIYGIPCAGFKIL